jgi:hypothetical protein
MKLSFSRVAPATVSVIALLIGLAAINDDIRASMKALLSGHRSPELARVASSANDAAWQVMQAVKDQSLEHAPLTIFVVAAGVLLLFMLRT